MRRNLEKRFCLKSTRKIRQIVLTESHVKPKRKGYKIRQNAKCHFLLEETTRSLKKISPNEKKSITERLSIDQEPLSTLRQPLEESEDAESRR